MTGDEDATRRLTRDVARRSVEQLGEGLTRMAGETSALQRWLLTMLVALNGAGILLCFSLRREIAAAALSQIVFVFFAGVMAALLAALVGLVLAQLVARAMRSAIAQWTDVSVSGDLSEGALASAKSVKLASMFWLAASSFVGLFSLALFLIGAATIGEQMFFPAAKKTAPVAVPIPAAAPANAVEPVKADEPKAAGPKEMSGRSSQAPRIAEQRSSRQTSARVSAPAPSRNVAPAPQPAAAQEQPSTAAAGAPPAAAPTP